MRVAVVCYSEPRYFGLGVVTPFCNWSSIRCIEIIFT